MGRNPAAVSEVIAEPWPERPAAKRQERDKWRSANGPQSGPCRRGQVRSRDSRLTTGSSFSGLTCTGYRYTAVADPSAW